MERATSFPLKTFRLSALVDPRTEQWLGQRLASEPEMIVRSLPLSLPRRCSVRSVILCFLIAGSIYWIGRLTKYATPSRKPYDIQAADEPIVGRLSQVDVARDGTWKNMSVDKFNQHYEAKLEACRVGKECPANQDKLVGNSPDYPASQW